MGFGTFCRVLEIVITVFQPLESFGEKVFQNGYGKVVYSCLGKFAVYNIKHNPPKKS